VVVNVAETIIRVVTAI